MDFFNILIEKEITSAISEIERVLRPEGLVFVTVCGRYSLGKVRECLVRTARKIGPRTYVPTMGQEKGLPHFIYNAKVLKAHYRNFKFLDFWKDDKDYYCFLGQKKSGKQ